MNKNIIISAVVALVISLIVAGSFSVTQSNKVGGLSERDVKAVTMNVTGDTTLNEDLILNQAGFCIDVYATSTATRGNIYASTTATIEGVDGVMMFRYGSCQ